MSFKSQETNMQKLAMLLGNDLGYICGERESGPNGAKKVFLNVGKTFLRAMAKDLGLREVTVRSNAGGIGVSGDCNLCGMWEDGGIYISISQPCGGQNVLLYRSIRNLKDHRGGYNHFISRLELANMGYAALLNRLLALRKDVSYERAA